MTELVTAPDLDAFIGGVQVALAVILLLVAGLSGVSILRRILGA